MDVLIFKAHSVREASAIAAFNKRVTIENILQAAEWSTDSTFRRFYYQPSHSAVYGQKVLQPTSSENANGGTAGVLLKFMLGNVQLLNVDSSKTLPVSHAVNLTKYNYQFGEGPIGACNRFGII